MGFATVGPYEVSSLAFSCNRPQGWRGEYTICFGDELMHRETMREYRTDLLAASAHALELGKKHAQRLIDEEPS
jgi:hypothetical protein